MDSDATTPPSGPASAPNALEAMTMALYVSLSLLAVLVAMPVGGADDRVRAGWTVLLTGLGLVLAHAVAMRISTRLAHQGVLTEESKASQRSQALGGVSVALFAAVPVFVFGEATGEELSELLLLTFVTLVGYRAVRAGSSRPRALLYVAGVFVAVSAIVIVKIAVAH